MAYKGQTATVTDPNTNTITKVTDVAGKLRCVIDPSVNGSSGNCAGVAEPGGTTNYTYDSFDNLVTWSCPYQTGQAAG
jgi:YD repeat-containing protein